VTDLKKYLPTRKRAVQIAVVAALLLLVGWWWQGRMKAASARRFVPAGELDRILYAVGGARSWHVATTGMMRGQPFQNDEDVVCPFQTHTITRAQSASGDGALLSEMIETVDHVYAREGTGKWSAEPKAPTDKCRQGPMAGPSPLISTLAGLKGAALVRGETLQMNGNSCRMWSFRSSNSGLLMATLCVDDATQLPYQVKMGTLDARYFNWNMPIEIDAPADAPATP
jgi:hypothetical protein